MYSENLDDKFIVLRKDKDPNSLFASFKLFKILSYNGIFKPEERTPYPMIISNPMLIEVLYNLNKSDVLLGLCFLPIGFFGTVLVSKRFLLLSQKFLLTKYAMMWYLFVGANASLFCSFYRLTGFMDNGLRWKHQERLYSKYDFTRDFELNTIFKHFRERPDD